MNRQKHWNGKLKNVTLGYRPKHMAERIKSEEATKEINKECEMGNFLNDYIK